MDKIEQTVPKVSDYFRSVIKELRAGSRLTDAAWLLIVIWMMGQESVSFQPVIQASPPPHL